MARPRVPLISRRKALEAALGIIDSEGLKALSIRRLGEVMNVNGASLYHHFKDKDEILVGVAQLALADVTAPRSESDNWRVWLPLNAYRTRQALIAHPELIPLMLRRIPLGIGNQEVEASVARLRAEGVEMSVIAPLMESFELLAISSALQTVGGVASAEEREKPYGAYDSMYQQAQRERGLSNDELFEVVCAAVIASVESAVHLKEARASIGTAFAAAAVAAPATAAPATAAPATAAPATAVPDAPATATSKARSARTATARKPAAAKTTATSRKPAAAAKPAGTTRRPAAAAKPASATRKPAASATRKPAASAKAAGTRKPAAAAKPAGTTRKPAGSAKLAGTSRKPAAAGKATARKSVPGG
jgi:TetR/AcrR family transcriptional regulator, tetracycline repressor protein